MSDSEIQPTTERTKVGFPQASEPEKKRDFSFMGLIIFFLILVLLGGGVWFMFFRSGNSEIVTEVSPTSVEEEEVITETPIFVTLNKDNVKIQILNGSGISGLAGKLKSTLESAGYKEIETGNADSYTYKITEVSYSNSLSNNVKSDITTALEKLYGEVVTKTNTSTKYNVIITIGYPSGYSPSPVDARNSVTPTVQPTSKVSGTITPTKKPTSTVTPTP